MSSGNREDAVDMLLTISQRIADKHILRALTKWNLLSQSIGLDKTFDIIHNLGIAVSLTNTSKTSNESNANALLNAIALTKRRSAISTNNGDASPKSRSPKQGINSMIPLPKANNDKKGNRSSSLSSERNQVEISENSEEKKPTLAKRKWKEAIKRVSLFKNESISVPKTEVIEDDDSKYLPNRFVDYFLVCSVFLPDEILESIDIEKMSQKQIEDVLQQTELLAGVSDRFPLEDYKDFPADNSWTNFAFPSGINLSWEKRPPRFHFSVLTDAKGGNIYATFVQFDQPLSTILKYENGKGSNEDTVGEFRKTSIGVDGKERKQKKKEIYLPRAIGLISHYPFFSEFRKTLIQLLLVAQDPHPLCPIESYVKLIAKEVPLPVEGHAAVEFLIQKGNPIKVKFDNNRHPLCSRMPLTLLFDMLSIDTILGILSALLCERRILFHSASVSSLTIASQCMLQLLYPFRWCSVFIPVVPESMLQVYQYPQPYVQGIHSKFLQDLDDFGDVILVDLDQDVIRCVVPLPQFPIRQINQLAQMLQELEDFRVTQRDFISVGPNDPWDADSESSLAFDANVQEAFLIFFGGLFNGYRKFVYFIDGVPIFNTAQFLQSKSADESLHRFLVQVVDTRLFDSFLAVQHEEDANLFIDYIANETQRCLEDIRRVQAATIKTFKIPEVEAVKTSTEHMSSTHIASQLKSNICPFLEPLKPALLKTARKFRLKMKRKKYEIIRRSHHLEDKCQGDNIIRGYVLKLFTSKSVTQEEQWKVESSLRDPASRLILCEILRQPGAKYSPLCLSIECFKAFTSLVSSLLRNCTQSNDLVNASTVLIAVTKFYCEINDHGAGVEQRRFVLEEKEIRRHPLWHSEEFWETALDEHVKYETNSIQVKSREQMNAMSRRESASSELLSSPEESEKDTEKISETDLAVQWLIQVVPQMFQIGMNFEDVEKYVFILAKKFGASIEDLGTLSVLVNNVSKVEIAI